MTRSYVAPSLCLSIALLLGACGGGKFESGDATGGSGGDTSNDSGSGTSDGSGGGSSDGSSSGSSDSSGSGGSTSSGSGSNGTSSGSGGTGSGSGGASSGSGGTGSGSGGTGSGSGGTGSGSGGTGSGSGGTGGSGMRGQCDGATDCLAAADFGDPCYSEGCSLPVAVSLADVEQDSCLVPWERRGDGRPATCDPPDQGTQCPEYCAQPPQCIDVGCHNAQCELTLGYDDQTCGGSGGSGGTSGSGGTTSTGGSGGTGGNGNDCEALNEARQAALTEAVSCNPEIDGPQCTGEKTVPDQCGCPVLVNELNAASAAAAQAAYDAWVEAECGPYACGAACFVGEEGTCSGETSTCAWLGVN